jgi:DNA polymerase-3 subunit delta'
VSKKNVSSSTQSSFSKALPEIVLRHHQKTLNKPMREWQSRKQIPPVLLLTGQPGIGKRLIAHHLAQWILCEHQGLQSQSNVPCHQCPACQKFLSGNETNFSEIISDDDEEGHSVSGSLKIEQFRKLKTTAGFSADEGKHKIFLISNAERMTLQAANSVLKILEEPSPGWVFFLTTHDTTLLLPTLVSRCQTLRLKPLLSEEIHELLLNTGVEAHRAEICAKFSQGSWERALTFSENENWEQRQTLIQFLKSPSSVLQAVVDWSTQKPHHFEIVLDLLEQFTADLIRWSIHEDSPQYGKHSWKNIDGADEFSAHARRIFHQKKTIKAARNFWICRAERLASARQQSLAPLNRKLLIQDVLLPWMEEHS